MHFVILSSLINFGGPLMNLRTSLWTSVGIIMSEVLCLSCQMTVFGSL